MRARSPPGRPPPGAPAGCRGPAIHPGNPTLSTISQLTAKIGELLGVPVATQRQPMPADDPGRRRPDISRARDLLGWQPAVSLDDGLRATIDYFKEGA
jgi:nucleoside-diphosphate-sugar epimerase